MAYYLLQKVKKFRIVFYILFDFCINFSYGTNVIQKLSHRDVRFKEFLLEIEKNYKKIAQNETNP